MNQLTAEEQKKIQLLKQLDTKRLVDLIPTLEQNLEAALRELASLKNLNSGYLSSAGSDCAEAKRILAELTVRAEGKNKEERDAWLTKQRSENSELVAALNRQESVSFQIENLHIDVEMAKRKLENVKAVLALKTAQLQFLSS